MMQTCSGPVAMISPVQEARDHTFYIKQKDSTMDIIIMRSADPSSLHVCGGHFDEYSTFTYIPVY